MAQVLNVNFGPSTSGGPYPVKVGLAATGCATNDVWNYFGREAASQTLSNLAWADGSPSGAYLEVSNAYGADFNGTDDAMFQSYIYAPGDNGLSVLIGNLPAGNYAFYLYGHGGNAEQNSIFSIPSGTSQGAQGTSPTAGWNVMPWTAGKQYALFTNITVAANTTVQVAVSKDASVFAFINGLQIVRHLPTNDGISAAWRQQYFGAYYYLDARAMATADPDGDGAANFQEFKFGSDPLNGNSAVRVPVSVSTYAGAGPGNQDGYRTNAGFAFFSVLRYDSQGRLWIGDQYRIRIMDTSGNVTTYAGTNQVGMVDGPVAQSQFGQIDAMVFDSQGKVFVNDRSNHRIRKIDPVAGTVKTFAGTTQGYLDATGTDAKFNNPMGLAIDSADNIYVADFYNYRVRKVTPLGVVTTIAGSGGAGSGDGSALNATFNSPTCVTLTPDGSLYITDYSNGKVRKLAGGTVSTVVSGLSLLDNISSDAGGSFYVIDGAARQATKYSGSGALLWRLSPTQGYQDGPVAGAKFGVALGQPLALADGNVFIADPGNGRLRLVTTARITALTISPAGGLFTNNVSVSLGSNGMAGSVIRYTVDGSDPALGTSITYTGPIAVSSSVTVKARAFVSTNPVSEMVSQTYTKVVDYVGGVPNSWRELYFGAEYAGNPNSAADADPDADGMTNYQEYLAGTNPTDAASNVRVPISVSTYAGSVQGNADGYRLSATFGFLSALRKDSSGRLWIGDPTAVRIMDVNGNVTTYAGTNQAGLVDGPVAEARFGLIDSLVIDSQGAVFVNDRSNHRIRKLDPVTGMVTTFAGSTAGFQDGTGTDARFNNPIGMTIDSADNLYVADFYNYRVRKITPQGVVTTVAGSGGAGSTDGSALAATFNSPTAVTVTANGVLYVTDWSNGKVRKVSGGTVSTIVSGLSFLDNINSDSQGNLYVVDDGRRQLTKYTTNGSLIWRWSPPQGMQDGALGVAKFGTSFGVPFIFPNGDVLISDASNYRLRLITVGAEPGLVIYPGANTFITNVVVSISNSLAAATVRYTVNGSEPTASSPAYAGGFTVNSTTTVKARGFVDGSPVTPVFSKTYTLVSDFVGGVPNTWRQQYFGADFANDERSAADADPDADGMTNYQEYLAGTDPLNATSLARVPVSVSTYAGAGPGNQDGNRTNAGFAYFSVTRYDSQGRLWIADQYRIRIMDVNGEVTTYTGTNAIGMADGPVAQARFNQIDSLVFDSHGNVFVNDRGNHRIRKIDPVTGMVTTFAGTVAGYKDDTGTNAMFNQPMAMAIDPADNLYVADFYNYRVRKVTPEGVVTTVAGSGGSGSTDGSALNATFNSPTCVTLTPDGGLYITDWANGKVRRLSDGIVSTVVSGLSYLDNISSDSEGNIYVVDTGLRRVSKYTGNGVLQWRIAPAQGYQDGPIQVAKFGSAFGQPLVLPNGNLFVPDPANGRLRQVNIGVDPGLAILPASSAFTNTVLVSVINTLTNAVVRYTLNGTDPGVGSPVFPSGITLSNSATVKVRAYVNNFPVSPVRSQSFTMLVDFVDGIANGWKLQYFGVNFANNPQADANADPDGDGMTNYQEFLAGTDPLSASSSLRVPVSVSTYAGAGPGNQDGYRTNIGLAYFAVVRYDSQGRLWFGDKSRIRIMDTAGNVTTYTGTNEMGMVDGPVAEARFAQIDALVFDSQGKVFVNDRSNHRIRKIDPVAGTVVTFAGSTAGFQNGTGTNARFNNPIGMTIDTADNLYVADFYNYRVRKVTPEGVVTTLAGGGSPGSADGNALTATFNSPTAVTMNPDGNLYVTDWSNGKVRKISEGVVSTVVSGLSYLDNISSDSSGNLYVVDNGRRQLSKYKANGTLLWRFAPGLGMQDGPTASAKFGDGLGQPLPLPNGNVFFPDAGNGRLRLISTAADPGLTILPATESFTNSLTVSISNRLAGAVVRYTLDNNDPTSGSMIYSGPFGISNQTTVKARAFVNGHPVSLVVSQSFNRIYALATDGIPANWRLQYFGAGYLTDPRAAAGADPDGDGITNLQEYLSGSDPLNALSGFAVDIRLAPVITWTSVPNNRYRIWRKDSVGASTQTLVISSYVATSNISVYVDLTTTNNASFYVIEVVP